MLMKYAYSEITHIWFLDTVVWQLSIIALYVVWFSSRNENLNWSLKRRWFTNLCYLCLSFSYSNKRTHFNWSNGSGLHKIALQVLLEEGLNHFRHVWRHSFSPTTTACHKQSRFPTDIIPLSLELYSYKYILDKCSTLQMLPFSSHSSLYIWWVQEVR